MIPESSVGWHEAKTHRPELIERVARRRFYCSRAQDSRTIQDCSLGSRFQQFSTCRDVSQAKLGSELSPVVCLQVLEFQPA